MHEFLRKLPEAKGILFQKYLMADFLEIAQAWEQFIFPAARLENPSTIHSVFPMSLAGRHPAPL